MDCGIQDIPAAGVCNFCKKTWYRPNPKCKCKCHPIKEAAQQEIERP